MNKSVQERIEEFIEYHINGDGECNAILLREYAREHNLNRRERFDLAYFFSVVYCCESGIVLFGNREKIKTGEADISALKRDVIFQSDRKYVKMRDCFRRMLLFWREELAQYDTNRWISNGVLVLEKAIREVENWYMFGRFSTFLFLETYATLLDIPVSETTIDWENGDTATSGLMNLFGDDREANEFDRSGILLVPPDKLNARFKNIASRVSSRNGDANATKLETSLCAYRKFYKGSRYNGFYLDRMLEELNWYRENRPQYANITNELFDIRSRVFDNEFLGEKHGWRGIRKEAKKLYQEFGII